ncbi:MAG: S9 family peptidase [Sphingomonadaceae bacterium]|nr:S9 family peptidase [Sphingomonadaceae bacterium]
MSAAAILTLPPGRAAKGLPLVVLPHGGPGASDDPGFNWLAQAIASRGYAVLQPQFRGSTGFVEPFHAAGYGEWGRKMQTDLSDGVAHLAKDGTIDPKRVCIVGGSYGGYAALAGVTLQHGIYRCAVSLAGPSDLKAMLSYETDVTSGSDNPTLRFWKRFMGARTRTDPMLDTISPIRFAVTVDVPVMLIHGKDDTVVTYDQSRAMAAALTKAGHPPEFVTLPGEDHWLSRGQTRTAMLAATIAFLAKHLPPDAAATGSAKAAAAP